jgi:hypothetical protein
MASGEFTAALCEQLYAAPKYVASKIRWRPGSGEGVLIFQAKVLTQDGTGLDLSGYWKKVGRHNRTRWGFSLKHLGHCIRTYDMADSHKNPGETGRIKGPHKHRFSSSKIERYAYKPDPPISESDPNEALMDFLKEGNIELRSGDYQDFMFV